LYARTSA